MLKIGDRAPEFCLRSEAAKETSLKDFKGKRVLIFFFPKANTSG
jgi:peroxiredoxin Q/BCP